MKNKDTRVISGFNMKHYTSDIRVCFVESSFSGLLSVMLYSVQNYAITWIFSYVMAKAQL